MMGYGAGFGLGFGGLLTLAGCVLLVVGLVVLAAWALDRLVGARRAAGYPGTALAPAAPAEDPLDVLRARLARGEITADEFATVKQTLEAGQ